MGLETYEHIQGIWDEIKEIKELLKQMVEALNRISQNLYWVSMKMDKPQQTQRRFYSRGRY